MQEKKVQLGTLGKLRTFSYGKILEITLLIFQSRQHLPYLD